MTKEDKQRKNAKAAAKLAPLIGCTCGSRRTVAERWNGRMIWECENCHRKVWADKEWEVSVGWFLGMSDCVDGMVRPWNERDSILMNGDDNESN